MEELIIGNQKIEKGNTYKIELPLASLYTSNETQIPVFIRRGEKMALRFLSVQQSMVMS